jgi:hypothetical protein
MTERPQQFALFESILAAFLVESTNTNLLGNAILFGL